MHAFASYVQICFSSCRDWKIRSLLICCITPPSIRSFFFPSRFHEILVSAFLRAPPFAFFFTHAPPLLFASPCHPTLHRLFPSFLSSFLPSPSPLPYPPSLIPLSFNLSSFPRLRLHLCILYPFPYRVSSNSSLFTIFFPFPFSFLRLLPRTGHPRKADMYNPWRKMGIRSSEYSRSKLIPKCR